jgi:hypothetical protein
MNREDLNSQIFFSLEAEFAAARTVQGCQIFVGTGFQNLENLPNQHKMYQMVIKFPKCP